MVNRNIFGDAFFEFVENMRLTVRLIGAKITLKY